jgi:hypothetical protein
MLSILFNPFYQIIIGSSYIISILTLSLHSGTFELVVAGSFNLIKIKHDSKTFCNQKY